MLVVNDLVAHGLDFPKCDLVVNLELPSDAAHYAHRAGRTGRLGALGGAGVVLSIVVRGVDRFVIEDKIAKEQADQEAAMAAEVDKEDKEQDAELERMEKDNREA